MLGSANFMTVAAIAALPGLVAGIRPPVPVRHSEDATNPAAKPLADLVAAPTRRIQYLPTKKAGLMDRRSVFTFLNTLAHFHNATAYIPGGMDGARLLLDGKHSASIEGSWSFYLDTTGNGGNPFHSADKTRPHCRSVTDPHTDWARIFDDGGDCVNIPNSYYSYHPSQTHKFHSGAYTPRYSSTVKHAAHKVLEGISGEFGLLHVRRCDRLGMNRRCTDPDHVASLVEKHNVTSWLVFTFAETGYVAALQKRLDGLSSRHFAYEDDIFSGIQPAGDNYLRYAAVSVLESMAEEVIDMHMCNARSLKKRQDNWMDEASLQAALSNRGICGGAAANGPYTPRSKSTVSANSTYSTKHKALLQRGARVRDEPTMQRRLRATG